MASRAGKSTVNMFLPLSHMKNQEKIAEKNAAEAYSSNGGQKRTKSHELAGLRERRSKISNKPEVTADEVEEFFEAYKEQKREE